MRASVSCWLLAGGCPHFLVIQKGRELDASKVEVIVLSKAITEVTSITSVIFYLFEISHSIQPTFKGRGTHRFEYQEGEVNGSHFRSWLQGGKATEDQIEDGVTSERKQRAEMQEAH